MTLPIPNLDDRDFKALRDEAVKMIPRYFPKWTDHNLSDPGITLIELFAFLSEASLYSINMIPEKTLENFAKFFGVIRQPGDSISSVLREAYENMERVSRAVTENDYKNLILSEFKQQIAKVSLFKSRTVLKRMKITGQAGNFISKNENQLVIRLKDEIGFNIVYPEGSIVELFAKDGAALLYQTRCGKTYTAGSPLYLKPVLDEEKLNEVSQACIYTEVPVHLSDDSKINIVLFPNSEDIKTETEKRKLCDVVYQSLKNISPVATRLNVCTPIAEQIAVQVGVVFDKSSRLEKFEAADNVKAAIECFLDPVTGGVDGNGWIFGRKLYRSELYYVIENTPGVDHVKRMAMAAHALPSFNSTDYKNPWLPLTLSMGYFYPVKIIVEITND